MAEIIEYRGYRLSGEPPAPGSKILIFPPASLLPLPTILFQRRRLPRGERGYFLLIQGPEESRVRGSGLKTMVEALRRKKPPSVMAGARLRIPGG
jgi:hypothetical protein